MFTLAPFWNKFLALCHCIRSINCTWFIYLMIKYEPFHDWYFKFFTTCGMFPIMWFMLWTRSWQTEVPTALSNEQWREESKNEIEILIHLIWIKSERIKNGDVRYFSSKSTKFNPPNRRERGRKIWREYMYNYNFTSYVYLNIHHLLIQYNKI